MSVPVQPSLPKTIINKYNLLSLARNVENYTNLIPILYFDDNDMIMMTMYFDEKL